MALSGVVVDQSIGRTATRFRQPTAGAVATTAATTTTLVTKGTSPPPEKQTPIVNEKNNQDDNNNNRQQQQQQMTCAKPIRRFYIDELGFYRHLDPDQKQYVCSNINAVNIKLHPTHIPRNSKQQQQANDGSKSNESLSGQLVGGDDGSGGYEICFKTLRRELGISHFDRTDDYENWKRSWDEFMRIKLISQQPVTLNRELKNRVRSGIPHDYRCKVWSAIIRMRTKSLRAQFGEDIYEVIMRDFVAKIDIPDYTYADQDYLMATNAATGGNNQTLTSRSSSSSSSSGGDTSGSDGLGRGGSEKGSRRADEQQPGKTTWAPHTNNTNNNSTTLRPPILEPALDKCFKQIELDLLRTLPNNRHFEEPNSRGVHRVRRVLRAYAYFNQSVGYCQGMNRLAAMALLVLPEEEAFWCLVAIIQCIMPKDYYLKPWLAQVDCCVLSELLEKKMAKLHKHLVKNDIQLTLFTWFFTIFVDGFRPELMLRIWDCFLLEGDKVLFRFALAILYISQDDLLKMNDFSSMCAHLSRIVSTRELDMEHLFETFSTINPLSSGTLQSRREYHRNRMQSTILDD